MSELLHRTLGETVAVEVVLGLWRTEADPNALESALLKLAVNARDAMPQGGSLTIETANARLDAAYAAAQPEVTPGQYVVLSVSDTGTGMDAATIQQAFEPFFTTKPVGQGPAWAWARFTDSSSNPADTSRSTPSRDRARRCESIFRG